MGAFLERNRRHWTERALKFGDSCVASWDDPYMIALEIETIGGFLKSGQRVLDAGCGNGYAALAQLKKKKLRSVTGIDFCPEFVDAARKAQKKQRAEKHSAFSVGDIRRLSFPSGSFDVVYTRAS